MTAQPNPWRPMTRPIDLKHLGKLDEELHELTEAASRLGKMVSRCMIQGIDEVEPVTLASNRKELEKEIADVAANIHLVVQHFHLDDEFIGERSAKKIAFLRGWHSMLAEPSTDQGD